MIRTPAHKQTDPKKKPGQKVDRISLYKKLYVEDAAKLNYKVVDAFADPLLEELKNFLDSVYEAGKRNK